MPQGESLEHYNQMFTVMVSQQIEATCHEFPAINAPIHRYN